MSGSQQVLDIVWNEWMKAVIKHPTGTVIFSLISQFLAGSLKSFYICKWKCTTKMDEFSFSESNLLPLAVWEGGAFHT